MAEPNEAEQKAERARLAEGLDRWRSSMALKVMLLRATVESGRAGEPALRDHVLKGVDALDRDVQTLFTLIEGMAGFSSEADAEQRITEINGPRS